MVARIAVERSAWLGYRWQQHGLAGEPAAGRREDLLLLGFQQSRGGGAEQSLAQRGIRTGAARAIGPDGPLVVLWSVRGAPHAHRAGQLDLLRDALAPQASDEEGPGYVAAVQEVAGALRAVVTGPVPKGTASREVAQRVSPALVSWCPRCRADHVPDGLFRAAGRAAQVVLGPEDQRGTVLHPRPAHDQVQVDRPGLALLTAYLRVNGPTTRSRYRDWTAGGATATDEVWQQLADVVPVQVAGRRADLPGALVDPVRTAPPAEGAALLPPHDAWLRQVDRTLLVPDAGLRRQVWKALSPPGALVVDGEVAGTWRHRRSERELTITPFAGVPAARRAAAEERARALADAVGAEEPRVRWADRESG